MRPGPFVSVMIFLRDIVDPGEEGLLCFTSEVWIGPSPLFWPDSTIVTNPRMLEKQSLIALKARVELGCEIYLRDLDPLATLLVQILNTRRRSPAIDVHDVDPARTVSIIIFIFTLRVEVVLKSVIPLHFAVLREVVNAFVF